MAVVVLAGKPFLDEAVEDDEKVSRSHLLQFELGLAGGAVGPGIWDNGVGIATNDGLQGQFHGEVVVLAEDGFDTLDDFLPVELEGVGGVVVGELHDRLDEVVEDTIEHLLDSGVVMGGAALRPACSKDAVITLKHFSVKRHEVVRAVGGIRHDNGHRIAPELFKAPADGKTESVGRGVVDISDAPFP